MAFAHEPRAQPAAATWIGLNWLVVHHARADTIVWHNGGTGGYRTFIGLEPSREGRRRGADELPAATAPTTSACTCSIPAIPLAPKPRRRSNARRSSCRPTVLARYVGVVPARADVLDQRDGGRRRAVRQPTGNRGSACGRRSETDFFLKEVDAQVTFVRDAQRRGDRRSVLHRTGRTARAEGEVDRPGRDGLRGPNEATAPALEDPRHLGRIGRPRQGEHEQHARLLRVQVAGADVPLLR